MCGYVVAGSLAADALGDAGNSVGYGLFDVGGGDVGAVDADAFSLVNAIYVAQGLYVLPAKILFVGGKAAAGGDVVQLLASALADGPVVGVAVHDARDADVLKVHLQKRWVAAVPEWRRNNNDVGLGELMCQIEHGVVVVFRVAQLVSMGKRFGRERAQVELFKYQLLGDVFARLLQVCHQCIGDFPGVRSFAQHAAVDVEQLFHEGVLSVGCGVRNSP